MAARSDADLLEDLLAVEERLTSAYEGALRDDAIDPELGQMLLDHENAHVEALRQALRHTGGARSPQASVPPAELNAALRDRAAFAGYALAQEARAVAAYRRVVAQISRANLRQALGSIMTCEAAHEVALRESLGDGPLVD
jgi:Mn-containing catalase